MKKILVILIVSVILFGAGFGIKFIINMFKTSEPVACTMDAKLCSDGSYVGRVAPECNFAPCPKEDLIRVESPIAYQAIESPLEIQGTARGNWYFEATFPIELLDGEGKVIAEYYAQAESDWMTTDFVPFKAVLNFEAPTTKTGQLVLKKDNPSGLPEYEDELRVPVNFNTTSSEELMTVNIFLSNSNFVNEPYFDCSRTISVEREVPKTSGVAKAAIEALLKGATQEEIDQGFISDINPGVKLQKITIENGVAKVDFDEQLEFQVGGSCQVAAIRAQITDTLKQFPTVNSVIISINDRTEDILQP